MRHSLILQLTLGAIALTAGAWLALSARYRLTPVRLLRRLIRVLAIHIYGWWYRGDRRGVQQLVSRYAVGTTAESAASAAESWVALETTQPTFRLRSLSQGDIPAAPIPFVCECQHAEYLVVLRHTFRLDDLIKNASSEYEAMLRLGAWLGTQWDHGTDELVDSHHVCNPTATIEAGRRGAKYWCEIAARTAVHAFTSLGWMARVVTGSRDGYTWEHAVAEIWCNQFRKWVLLDTDFNIVYERDGVPLSAWELCREGLQLRGTGRILVRRFAPLKASLPDVDLMPYYEYIHVDLRNDWCSRAVRRGSPVGSDLATWWTARPSFGPLITAAVRVDDVSVFNWNVNQVLLEALGADQCGEGRLSLRVGLRGYSPTFVAFQSRFDSEDWRTLSSAVDEIVAMPGRHRLQVRLLTASGFGGMVSEVQFMVRET